MARPLAFEPDHILKLITASFWQNGYHHTSIDDLVKATNLKKGSLYGYFGSKEEMFQKALAYYWDNGPLQDKKEQSPTSILTNYFRKIVSEIHYPIKDRRGCLIFNSCLEFGNSTKDVSLRKIVLSYYAKRRQFFEQLLDRARQEGELSQDLDIQLAADRIFVAAFSIRELSKFISEKKILNDIAAQTFEALGLRFNPEYEQN